MLLALFGVLLAFSVDAASQDGALDDLDRLVGRWMELRRTTADEKRAWEAQEQQWRTEIRLLEVEKAALEKEAAEARTLSTSVEKEGAAVLERKKGMTRNLYGLRPVLDRAESRLRHWESLIPSSLSGGLTDVFRGLPRTQKEAEKRPLSERVQMVLALYARIESLQHGLHASREVLHIEDTPGRQVEVLYVGLARGFAVSADSKWAAVGVPCSEGWAWEARPGIAEEVRDAIDVLNRQKSARLVALPMKVSRRHQSTGRQDEDFPNKASGEGGAK